MNRVSVTSSAAFWIGCAVVALLSVGAEAADRGRSVTSESSTAATQQQLEAAQRRLDRAAQDVADLSTALAGGAQSDVGAVRSNRRSQRAVLGVNIGSDEDGKRSEGVQVLSVNPRGGAYEAGLKSGDLLLAVNNQRLKLDEDGSPRQKLLQMMLGVRPGATVAVKYRREGYTRTVDVIARPIVDRPFNDAPSIAAAPAPAPRVIRTERVEAPKVAIQQAEGILASAELVPLTPTLGKYFGTDKGLLVVRAPTDETLDIQEGDVILEIGGRTPNDTSHALRILNSYQPGEELSLSVLRRKRRFDIEVTIPEDAPRARLEQRSDRPRGNVSQSPRANAVRPSRSAPAREPSESSDLEVQPLSDDDVEVEPSR